MLSLHWSEVKSRAQAHTAGQPSSEGFSACSLASELVPSPACLPHLQVQMLQVQMLSKPSCFVWGWAAPYAAEAPAASLRAMFMGIQSLNGEQGEESGQNCPFPLVLPGTSSEAVWEVPQKTCRSLLCTVLAVWPWGSHCFCLYFPDLTELLPGCYLGKYFLFLLLFGRTCGMWKFPGQGSNLYHSSNQSRSSDNAGSLTSWATGKYF